MKIGLVCPYSWDVPGGVQAHVRDLAEILRGRGHRVSVLSPVDDDDGLPDYVTSAGRPVPIPYNGSVSRLLIGPVSARRVRNWLHEGAFDVVHVHEPTAPSVSLAACWLAAVPIVVTHHTSTTRSRALSVLEPILATALEKVAGRIAVSEAARTTMVGHLGVSAVIIPNGVDVRRFAEAEPLPGHPDGRTVVFLGRIDEPRKGLAVLLEAMDVLVARGVDVRLIVAGPGDVDEVMEGLDPPLRDHVELLGLVDEPTKARLLRSADVFCAPNLGGESFGIVLTEAMAAGAAVLASDLDAFRRVLDNGLAGAMFPTGDFVALADSLAGLLADGDERRRLGKAGQAAVAVYDWEHVADEIVRVYETVVEGA